MGDEWAVDRPPQLAEMMLRGAMGRCPICGRGRVFSGYLRVVESCAECAAPLGTMRADDAPPYITILITAHVVVGLLVLVDRDAPWPLWMTAMMFAVLAAVMALALLRPIKGMTVAVLLRLAAQGLAAQADERAPHPRQDMAHDEAATGS